MRFRGYWSNDPADWVLCEHCDVESQWFTLHERPPNVQDWDLQSAPIKLSCGHTVELFEDVIPLRGQPA